MGVNTVYTQSKFQNRTKVVCFLKSYYIQYIHMYMQYMCTYIIMYMYCMYIHVDVSGKQISTGDAWGVTISHPLKTHHY